MRRVLLLFSAVAASLLLANGTALAEDLTGSDGPDELTGADGKDSVNGLDGRDFPACDDQVYGRSGDARVSGGPGNDEVSGTLGSDAVYGDDVVDDGPLFDPDGDRIFGGAGDDIMDAFNARRRATSSSSAVRTRVSSTPTAST